MRHNARVRSSTPPRSLPHPRLAVGSAVALAAMLLGAGIMPVPYAIEQPGPAIDVLGQYEDQDVLSISGARTYPIEGSLMMTTVAIDGGPGYTVTPAEVVRSWFDPTRAVMPRELYFPEGQTRAQTDLENSVQMSTSQQEAVAVALRELGHEVPAEVIVAGVQADTPAEGVLEPGDVVLEVDGTRGADAEGFRTAAGRAAEDGSVPMRIRRDGKEMELDVPVGDVDGQTRMGIVLGTGYDVPIDVEIGVGSVGGPSAGTMFALSVYDELTPGALTGGESIAGTGTIAIDETVGPIGGIRQKMVGAREAGAEYFLAPAGNCDEVVDHVPDGLDVVRISTFDEALDAVESIAENDSAEGLPTCG